MFAFRLRSWFGQIKQATTVNLCATGSAIIKGSISKDGFALPGVTIYITTGGIQFDSTTTGQDGKFSFADLHAGECTLRPELAGYTFSPASSTVTVPPDATAVNFTAMATPTTFNVSGRLIDDHGNALGGVKISVSNGAGSFTTDSNGNYGFLGLNPGTYTVTPSKTGYTFTPPSRTVTLPPDAEHIDFSSTAVPTTFSIQGSISKDGFAVPGVKLFITTGGIQFDSTTTGQDGAYSFANLHAGEYTLRPGLAGYTFSPVTRTITVPPDATAVNFTATVTPTTFNLSGPLTADHGNALGGVKISVSNGAGSFTTDSNGNYGFLGLNSGTYTITPSKTGYTFSPPSRTVTLHAGC